MDTVTTKDSSDRTSRWMEVGVHVYPLLYPRNPRADLWGAIYSLPVKNSLPFLAWPPRGRGAWSPGKGRAQVQRHLLLLTPPSLPTRVWALVGTLCSPTKEKTALS